jgi:S-DNA-T family DNA segregation ATPase FtsK/SpoIIIE
VVTRHEETISALRWAVKVMDDRYSLFQQAGSRDLASYNSNQKGEDRLPYIIILIDELADLMAVAAREVEASIVRLAQLARATGIHLVVATQRPSVDVITGLIKANITSRIAFAVASNVDSRTILDMSGAEKLLGNGDMLFQESTTPKPKRIQGVFLSDPEIHKVTAYIKKQGEAHYQEDILHYEPEKSATLGGIDADDDKFDEAVEIVLSSKRASASLLQRHLRVGYARAARLLDILEEQGIIGPSDGSNRSREILMDRDTYYRMKEAEKQDKDNNGKPPTPPPGPTFTDNSSSPKEMERDIDMGEIDN